MKRIWLILAMGATLSLMEFWEPAHGSVVVPMSLTDLSANAQEVVVGKVLYTRAVPKISDGKIESITTEVKVAVDRYLKGAGYGSVGSPYITVVQKGGVVGSITIRADASAAFSPEEKVLVFLKSDPTGVRRVVGMGQGKFSLRQSTAGKTLAVGTVGKPLEEDLGLPSSGKRSIRGSFSAVQMDLERFETTIEGLIAATGGSEAVTE